MIDTGTTDAPMPLSLDENAKSTNSRRWEFSEDS